MSPGSSQLSPSLIVLPDDGTSQSPLALTLNSAADKPVQGVAAEIAVKVTPLNRAAGTDIRISAFTEDSHQPGVYHAVLTAGTQKGEFLLTPELQGAELSPARAVIGKAPSVSQLTISGTLALGEALSGHYQFDGNNMGAADASRYQWGDEGQTASLNDAAVITVSGTVPAYTLVSSDAGKVKELSVQARNELDITGNTLTVNTRPGTAGNNTGGGNGGAIINEAAAPEISDLKITGTLSVGESLGGTYAFNPLTGNPEDKSLVAWGEKGTTDPATGTAVTTSQILPPYTLTAADAGKVLAVSVLAKNGAGVDGNTQTVTTDASAAEGNNTNGGSDGKIVAPSLGNIIVNGHNFSPDSGFPTTGFVNATFTLTLDNANASDYNWTSSASWVKVDSAGKVTFTAEPKGQEQVTITATPKTGRVNIHHSFTLERWYQFNSTALNWSDANSYCNSLGNGYALPTILQLTNVTSENGTRAVGGYLWSEWGNMATYGVLTDKDYWASEASISSVHYSVSLLNGTVTRYSDTIIRLNSCQRGL